jgi:hypothetical protein
MQNSQRSGKWTIYFSLSPPSKQEAPDIPLAKIAVIPVLPAVAIPKAILPQAIIAPVVIHIAQDKAKAQPAHEVPAIILAHVQTIAIPPQIIPSEAIVTPVVVQIAVQADVQTAQDNAIAPQANAAPAVAQ